MMRFTALLVLLFLSAACASSSRIIDKRTLRCEPGQDIGIAAGFDAAKAQTGELHEQVFLVQVANNSHSEVTVTAVRVEPDERNQIRLAAAYDGTEVTIAEGEDHVFRLPAREALHALSSRRPGAIEVPSGFVEFDVMVSLSNGDSYHCPFRVELR